MYFFRAKTSMGERLSFLKSTTDRVPDPGLGQGHEDLDLDQDQSDRGQDHARNPGDHGLGHDPGAQNHGNPAAESPGPDQGPRDPAPDQGQRTELGQGPKTDPSPKTNPSLVQNPDTNCGIYSKLRRVQIVMIFFLLKQDGKIVVNRLQNSLGS